MKTKTLLIFLLTVGCISSAIGQVNDSNVAAPLELATSIPLPNVTGRIGHLCYNSKQQQIYVAALGNNTLEVLDFQNKKKISSIKSFEQPQGVEFMPSSDIIIVTSIGTNFCKTFNSNTFKLIGSINLGPKGNTIKFSPLKQLVYIGYDGAIAVCDANSFDVKATIKLPGLPESFQVNEESGIMYVNVPKTK